MDSNVGQLSLLIRKRLFRAARFQKFQIIIGILVLSAKIVALKKHGPPSNNSVGMKNKVAKLKPKQFFAVLAGV